MATSKAWYAKNFWTTASEDAIKLVCDGYLRLNLWDINPRIRIDDIKNIVEKYLKAHDILSICGFCNKISYNGHTFLSHQSCLARTNIVLNANYAPGIHTIHWKVEQLSEWFDGIGICTDWYETGFNQSQRSWFESTFHIGWRSRLDNQKTPNRLLCGEKSKDCNIFYRTCNYVGDEPLPHYKIGDIIGLIYDCNKNTLQFERNRQILKSHLTNIPSNYKLFWFVAHFTNSSDVAKFSVLHF